MSPAVKIAELRFSYPRSGFSLAVDELAVNAGEKVALVGPSGSGKTTLLHLVAGILVPDAGHVFCGEVRISSLSDAARRDLRLRSMGLVFQDFELLEYLNVWDNILLPFRISSSLKLDAATVDRAKQLAHSVGLHDRLQQYVGRLAQGERQRVAVCRALLNQPSLLLADEPTGNLDPANKERVLGILFDYAQQTGAALLTVTHDHQLLHRFERVIDFARFCRTPS